MENDDELLPVLAGLLGNSKKEPTSELIVMMLWGFSHVSHPFHYTWLGLDLSFIKAINGPFYANFLRQMDRVMCLQLEKEKTECPQNSLISQLGLLAAKIDLH